jgi:hypothetical protein
VASHACLSFPACPSLCSFPALPAVAFSTSPRHAPPCGTLRASGSHVRPSLAHGRGSTPWSAFFRCVTVSCFSARKAVADSYADPKAETPRLVATPHAARSVGALQGDVGRHPSRVVPVFTFYVHILTQSNTSLHCNSIVYALSRRRPCGSRFPATPGGRGPRPPDHPDERARPRAGTRSIVRSYRRPPEPAGREPATAVTPRGVSEKVPHRHRAAGGGAAGGRRRVHTPDAGV